MNVFCTKKSFFRCVALVVAFSMMVSHGPVSAQGHYVSPMPVPGQMVSSTPSFNPLSIKGITFYPDNPFLFDFIIDGGDEPMASENEPTPDMQRLVHYFLTALTTPSEDLWVNLSPHEPDRIIPDTLAVTEMGRDLLAQDYLLKQLSASLMYPEDEAGERFWQKVYTKAYELYGHTDIPVDTFHKVWIMPESAKVMQHGQTVYVTEAVLGVELERDYVAAQWTNDQRQLTTDHRPMSNENSLVNSHLSLVSDKDDLSSDVMRSIILPLIKEEVNHGTSFATLRQIYHALILAKWFKQNARDHVLTQHYVDQHKVAGVDVSDPALKDDVYGQYMQALERGVFDFIQADSHQPSVFRKSVADSRELKSDNSNNEVVRRYFAGGFMDSAQLVIGEDRSPDFAAIAEGEKARLTVALTPRDRAQIIQQLPAIELDAAEFTMHEFVFQRLLEIYGDVLTLPRQKAIARMNVMSKARGNPVTFFDTEIEKGWEQFIQEHSQHTFILGEEGDRPNFVGIDHVWVIDPIDGTKRFIALHPHFATILAKFYHGFPQVAVTAFPKYKYKGNTMAVMTVRADQKGIRINDDHILNANEEAINQSDTVIFHDIDKSPLSKVIIKKLREKGYKVSNSRASAGETLDMILKGTYRAYVHLTPQAHDIPINGFAAQQVGLKVSNIFPLKFDDLRENNILKRDIVIGTKETHPEMSRIIEEARRDAAMAAVDEEVDVNVVPEGDHAMMTPWRDLTHANEVSRKVIQDLIELQQGLLIDPDVVDQRVEFDLSALDMSLEDVRDLLARNDDIFISFRFQVSGVASLKEFTRGQVIGLPKPILEIKEIYIHSLKEVMSSSQDVLPMLAVMPEVELLHEGINIYRQAQLEMGETGDASFQTAASLMAPLMSLANRQTMQQEINNRLINAWSRVNWIDWYLLKNGVDATIVYLTELRARVQRAAARLEKWRQTPDGVDYGDEVTHDPDEDLQRIEQLLEGLRERPAETIAKAKERCNFSLTPEEREQIEAFVDQFNDRIGMMGVQFEEEFQVSDVRLSVFGRFTEQYPWRFQTEIRADLDDRGGTPPFLFHGSFKLVSLDDGAEIIPTYTQSKRVEWLAFDIPKFGAYKLEVEFDSAMAALSETDEKALIKYLLAEKVRPIEEIVVWGAQHGLNRDAILAEVRRLSEEEKLLLPPGSKYRYTSFLPTSDRQARPTGNTRLYHTFSEPEAEDDWRGVGNAFLFTEEDEVILQVRAGSHSLDSTAGGLIDIGLNPQQATLLELKQESNGFVLPVDRLRPLKNLDSGKDFFSFSFKQEYGFPGYLADDDVFLVAPNEQASNEHFYFHHARLTKTEYDRFFELVQNRVWSWEEFLQYRDRGFTGQVNDEVVGYVRVKPVVLWAWLDEIRKLNGALDVNDILTQGIREVFFQSSFRQELDEAARDGAMAALSTSQEDTFIEYLMGKDLHRVSDIIDWGRRYGLGREATLEHVLSLGERRVLVPDQTKTSYGFTSLIQTYAFDGSLTGLARLYHTFKGSDDWRGGANPLLFTPDGKLILQIRNGKNRFLECTAAGVIDLGHDSTQTSVKEIFEESNGFVLDPDRLTPILNQHPGSNGLFRHSFKLEYDYPGEVDGDGVFRLSPNVHESNEILFYSHAKLTGEEYGRFQDHVKGKIVSLHEYLQGQPLEPLNKEAIGYVAVSLPELEQWLAGEHATLKQPDTNKVFAQGIRSVIQQEEFYQQLVQASQEDAAMMGATASRVVPTGYTGLGVSGDVSVAGEFMHYLQTLPIKNIRGSKNGDSKFYEVPVGEDMVLLKFDTSKTLVVQNILINDVVHFLIVNPFDISSFLAVHFDRSDSSHVRLSIYDSATHQESLYQLDGVGVDDRVLLPHEFFVSLLPEAFFSKLEADAESHSSILNQLTQSKPSVQPAYRIIASNPMIALSNESSLMPLKNYFGSLAWNLVTLTEPMRTKDGRVIYPIVAGDNAHRQLLVTTTKDAFWFYRYGLGEQPDSVPLTDLINPNFNWDDVPAVKGFRDQLRADRALAVTMQPREGGIDLKGVEVEQELRHSEQAKRAEESQRFFDSSASLRQADSLKMTSDIDNAMINHITSPSFTGFKADLLRLQMLPSVLPLLGYTPDGQPINQPPASLIPALVVAIKP